MIHWYSSACESREVASVRQFSLRKSIGAQKDLSVVVWIRHCTLHVFLVPLSLYFARPSKINWRSKRLECRLSGSYVCAAVEWRQSTERFLIKHLQAQRLILIFLKGYKAWWKGELIKVVGARQVLYGTPYPRKINSCVEWFVMISL